MAAVIAMSDEDYEPRFCADRILGGQVHDFLRVDLGDGSVRWLIPRCQESAARPVMKPLLEMRAVRRQRDEVCDACSSLRRRDRVTRRPLVWKALEQRGGRG